MRMGGTFTTVLTSIFFDGFPSPSNTGPVAGITFTHLTNTVINSTADNQIIENLFLDPGSIQVTHNNVIVRNCIINGTGCNLNGPVGQNNAIGGPDAAVNINLRVFNCRIYSFQTPSKNNSQLFDCIFGAIEVGYCDLSGCENGADVAYPIIGAAYTHDNYIHDFTCWDATQSPPDGSHCDGLQTFDISNSGGMTVRHNTVLGWQTSGTFLPRPGASSSCLAFITGQHDLTVDNNLFAGGSFTLYGPSQGGGGGHPVNVHVTNNHFSILYYPTCGSFGTHSGWDNTAVGWEWDGNVWHDGPNKGQAINVLPWPN